MKTIENRKTSIRVSEAEDKGASYFDLIMVCLNRTPQGGFTLEEMRRRLRVTDKLDPKKKSADLEDADFDKLKECVRGMIWGAMSKELVEFGDYIDSIK